MLRVPLAPRAADFHYQPITGANRPGALRRHIYTGVMGNTYLTLTTNMFLVAFGTIVHVSVFQWGVVGAVSAFAIVFQLFSAYASIRYGYRRLIWILTEGANRVLRTVAFALAYFFLIKGDPAMGASLLVLFLCVASFFGAAAQPPWLSWLADLIPEQLQGRFIGRRDAWIAFGTICVIVPVSYVLDAVGPSLKAPALAVAAIGGCLVGMVDLVLHRQIPEPECACDNEGFVEHVMAPIRDRQFLPWLVFSTVWNFGMNLGAVLSFVYFVDDLGIRNNYLGGTLALIVVPLLGTFCTSRLSGWLIDTWGIRNVLFVSHALWGIQPLFWLLATPGTAIIWLCVSSVVGGASTSASVNASIKLMTRMPARNRRAMYLAVATCCNSLASGVAILGAGWFIDVFSRVHWNLAGHTVGAFQVVFIASMALRLASWLLIFPVKAPAAATTVRETDLQRETENVML